VTWANVGSAISPRSTVGTGQTTNGQPTDRHRNELPQGCDGYPSQPLSQFVTTTSPLRLSVHRAGSNSPTVSPDRQRLCTALDFW
jgi:hypothetical protein